jgi:hypothetical protein
MWTWSKVLKGGDGENVDVDGGRDGEDVDVDVD